MTEQTKPDTSVSSEIEKALEWQVRLIVRETILQGVSEYKKINITEGMLEDAKSEARQAIQELLVKARISQTRKIQRHQKMVWGSDRDSGYFKAEVRQLQQSLKPSKEES